MAGPDNLRTRRSALTFGSGLLMTAVTIAVAFVSTPLLLRWLGAERFGAVRALSDWLGHLTLLELGLAGAIGPVLAHALAQADRTQLARAFSAGVRAFTLVAALALVAGAVVAFFIPALVPVHPGLRLDLRFAALIGLVGLALYPMLPFRVLAEAGQRGYAVHGYALAQSLVATSLALVLAWRGFGITGQLAALVTGQAVFAALCAVDGLRRLSVLRTARWSDGAGGEAERRLWQLNLPTLFTSFAGRIGLFTDNTVVALMLGPGQVAPLFLTQRLLALAGQQLLGLGNASWAALAELHALGRHEDFRARLLDLTRLVSGLAVAMLGPIAAWNHHFVARWVGAPAYAGDTVTLLAAVNGWMMALLSLWGWCFGGTGLIRALVPPALASGTLNLGLSIAATRLVGLPGPLWGTLLGLGATSLWMVPLLLRRHFGISVGALTRAVLTPVAWGAPLTAALWWLARAHEPPAGWLGLGAEMGGGMVILLGLWWFFALTEAERETFRERLRFAMRGDDRGARGEE